MTDAEAPTLLEISLSRLFIDSFIVDDLTYDDVLASKCKVFATWLEFSLVEGSIWFNII